MELQLEKQDREFQEWIADQDFNDKEKALWNFHKWMRQHTTLSSGTIVDYRKYVAEMMDDTGEIVFGKAELDSSHKQAAWNKFQEYKDSTGFAKTNATGEQQSDN